MESLIKEELVVKLLRCSNWENPSGKKYQEEKKATSITPTYSDIFIN
jgi:hypothetical protein